MTPTTLKSCGFLNASLAISVPKVLLSSERVTITPVAREIRSDGMELTKPSPIANFPNWLSASVIDKSPLAVKMMVPPIRLTSTMMIPAIASPLTNFEAPSIDP